VSSTSCQVKTYQLIFVAKVMSRKSYQVRSDHEGPGQDRTCQIISCQVKSNPVRFGQDHLGQIRPSQVSR